MTYGFKAAILAIPFLSLAATAEAGVTDIAQAPTGYFVPSDSLKDEAPYYRGKNGSWSWTQGAIGGSFSTATLSISAYDVDWGPDRAMEHDAIYAYDNGVRTYLGELTGANDSWAYTTFTLGSNFFDDIAAGLKIDIVIDTSDLNWQVTLAKSVLSTDAAPVPPATPGGTGVPEPLTLSLLGLGLTGLGLVRRGRPTQKPV